MSTSLAKPVRYTCFRSRALDLNATHVWFRPKVHLSRNLRLFRQARPPVPTDDELDPDAFSMRGPGTVLTITEASQQLRVSRWMIYRLIHSRQLKTIKLGRRRLIPARALDELVDDLTNQESW